MIIASLQPKVGLFDKVREYYKVNKHLSGLITVNETVFTEKIGRELLVVFPEMNQYDEVFINGIKFEPVKDKREEV